MSADQENVDLQIMLQREFNTVLQANCERIRQVVSNVMAE